MNASVQVLQVYEPDALPVNDRGAHLPAAGQDNERVWRAVIILTAFMLFIGLLISAGNGMLQWLDRPLNEIRIQGDTRHLDKHQLVQQLADVAQGTLFTVDMQQLQTQVLNEPWVQAAAIQRRWPAALDIQIEEQIPVARWGSKGLLNYQGDIFWPASQTLPAGLPELNGPASETQRLMQQYHSLSRMMQEAGIGIAGLTLEARGAWAMRLDNGIDVVLGRENITLRLQRFLHIYQQKLAAVAAQIERIDIRYTNGVAIKWRTPSVPVEVEQ